MNILNYISSLILPLVISVFALILLSRKKDYTSVFIDGARELISALYGKVRMYIITNGIERVQRRRWELSGLESYFDGLFISEAIGVNKPDPRFFAYVAERIEGFEPDTALVVGDSLSSDIAGGAGYRIDTCWFAPDGEESALPTYTVRALDEVLPIALGE